MKRAILALSLMLLVGLGALAGAVSGQVGWLAVWRSDRPGARSQAKSGVPDELAVEAPHGCQARSLQMAQNFVHRQI